MATTKVPNTTPATPSTHRVARPARVARLARATMLSAAVSGFLVAPGAVVAAADTSPATPPTPMTADLATATTIVLTSGVDGIGLSGATDVDGAPLEIRAVDPLYPTLYATVPGARWLSDRWIDGRATQASAWETTSGARIDATHTAVQAPDGSWVDYGEEWASSRTFRAPFSVPAGQAVTALRLELAVDNVAAVAVSNATGRTVVEAASCADHASCSLPGADGQDNFRVARTIDIPASATATGDNAVELKVDDWGSVVGIAFRVTVELSPIAPPPPAPHTCTPSPAASCSLTVAVMADSPAGTARFCYAPQDGWARTFWVADIDGVLRPHTLQPGTTVDAPLPADGTLRYPTMDATVAFDAIRDDSLGRCEEIRPL